jgi:hypothetical protein
MVQCNPSVELKSLARLAFAHYLRTGQCLSESAFGPARVRSEVKFNPYHDPRDGRFTFATGGGLAAGVAARPERRRSIQTGGVRVPPVGTPPLRSVDVPKSQATGFDDGVFRPRRFDASALRPVQLEAESRPRARSNFDSMIRPMTLQPGFPGFAGAVGGSIVNAADQFLEVTGPALDVTTELTKNASNVLINQIMKIDPHYRFDSLGFPQTIDGMNNQLNVLHRARAAAFYRMRREMRPLQVETLQFLQRRVDDAYAEGLRRQKEGRLNIRLSPNEALGNFVDQEARRGLRDMYRGMGISIERGEPVQVNRRHHDTRENDRTYRLPDARVGNVVFDMTLTRKTLAYNQVRGFFSADAEPEMVIIVRPRQLGPNHTYAIKTPGR